MKPGAKFLLQNKKRYTTTTIIKVGLVSFLLSLEEKAILRYTSVTGKVRFLFLFSFPKFENCLLG